MRAIQQPWNLQSFIYLTNKNSTDSTVGIPLPCLPWAYPHSDPLGRAGI